MIAALLLFALHIPAGIAPEQLMLLARQTDTSIMYDWNGLEPESVRALEGRYSLYEALCTLLQGTRLTFEFTSTTTVTVRYEGYRGERDEACDLRPIGLGPPWIHPPQADWR